VTPLLAKHTSEGFVVLQAGMQPRLVPSLSAIFVPTSANVAAVKRSNRRRGRGIRDANA